MRIGVVFPQTELGSDPAVLRTYGQRVEELGFTHILAYDHVVGADPTVRVARHKHCVSRRVTITPSFTGGGGVTASYLYVNGREVAKRHSAGSLRLSVSRLQHGVNSFELVSEFADGRAASVVGQLRRCR